MLTVLGFSLLAALGGYCLRHLARAATGGAQAALVEQINACLPQLQCGQCDYPGCRPYARAIAEDGAPISLCPPGGAETAARLARLLNQEAPVMAVANPPALLAVIREDDCVGCALCLPVCPTDAIVGAAKYAHTVIARDCVGCELCVAACPVDCIDIIPDPLST